MRIELKNSQGRMMNREFERYIAEKLSLYQDCIVKDAMIYCMDGGKRFRPRIIFAIAKGFGLAEEQAYPLGLALEMIQSYSLIHDDLPAMDNDDFRRGKPSCHKAFGEDMAILTGDALLTESFNVIADSGLEPRIIAKCISALSHYAGMRGMVYGQMLDVQAEKGDLSDLEIIQDHKTGGLFKISCLLPMYLADKNDEEYFINLGRRIGIIFQHQDDLFDLLRSKEDFGKSTSDAQNGKFTALSLYNIDELQMVLDDKFAELSEYLKKAPFDTSYLLELLQELKER